MQPVDVRRGKRARMLFAAALGGWVGLDGRRRARAWGRLEKAGQVLEVGGVVMLKIWGMGWWVRIAFCYSRFSEGGETWG